MKTLDIAGKDLLRSVRSASFLAFGFVVPLLVTALFSFAFGGMTGGQGIEVPTTRVQVVNLDEGDPQAGGFAAGKMLVDILQSRQLAQLLQTREVSDAANARAAVDRQEAGVAVIIPPGLTSAALNPEGRAALELYQDPTLTLGPGIVQGIVRQYVDAFSGSKIAAGIALDAMRQQGLAGDPGMAQAVAMQYAAWATALGQERGQGADPLLEMRSPSSGEASAASATQIIVSPIMAGMMVFYVFFTGAASAQSLLEEDEAGTLRRLFSTPTTHTAVLGGRTVATYCLLAVQILMLLVLSDLIFGINWGRPAAVALVAIGVVALSASFGLFVTSLLKSTRQGGVVYGGVLTVMGMLGMIGIFTANVPGAAQGAFDVISLLVPQGWGVRGWQVLLNGGGVIDVLPTVAVMLALAGVLFAIGVLRFRRRFA
jgi:ABC-2 type transport system permease protein